MEINFDKYPLPKRVRHHTAPNLYFKYEDFKEEPLYYPPLIESLDWSEVFLNGKPPDILDVGCGRGIFLLNMSEQFPDKNVLGIELRKPYPEWINNFVKGENIQNAAAVWYSVVNGMKFIETDSVEKVFYLFPDPWPKKRHLKRRAFNMEFLEEVSRILKPGGNLYLATDVPEVHEYHCELVDEFEECGWKSVEMDDEEWPFPPTNKENFCRKEGISFYRIIVGM